MDGGSCRILGKSGRCGKGCSHKRRSRWRGLEEEFKEEFRKSVKGNLRRVQGKVQTQLRRVSQSFSLLVHLIPSHHPPVVLRPVQGQAVLKDPLV